MKNRIIKVKADQLAQRKRSKPSFTFIDQRPEAIAQRKRLEMVSNSPQSRKAAQRQALANDHSAKTIQRVETHQPARQGIDSSLPVQRAVDLTAPSIRTTTNSHYYVNTLNTNTKKVMYSRTNVAAPKPTGLFLKESERSTAHLNLYKWTPNARLYGNDEKLVINEQSPGFQDQHKSDLVGNLTGHAMNPPLTEATLTAPSIGTVGDNDCRGWATTLREMATEEGADNRGLADGEMGVGDQMTHNFPDNLGLACSYHSATTVAKDGASLVTLEAHASKDLKHPEFHIRNGIAGFVADNNDNGTEEGRGLGNDVTIDRANPNRMALDTKKDQFKDAVETPRNAMASPYNSFSMVTETSHLHGAQLDLIRIIRFGIMKNWSKYSSYHKNPSEITEMRAVLRAVGDDPQSRFTQLQAVKRIANTSLGKSNILGYRRPATTRLCELVGGTNLKSLANIQAQTALLRTFVSQFNPNP